MTQLHLRLQYADHEGGLGMIGGVLAAWSRAPAVAVGSGWGRREAGRH